MENNILPNDQTYESFYQGSSGNVVILLPGLCGSELELGTIPRQLKKINCSYVIPRISGYSAHTGISPCENWIEQVDDIIIALKKNYKTVSIVGMSMGATLALAVAERNDGIDGLVLLSPVLFFDGWSVSWYQPLLKFIYAIGFRNWHHKETAPYGVKNRELRRRIEKSVKNNEVSELGAAHLPAHSLYQALRMIGDVKRNLHEVVVPLFIIHSVDDETASPKNPDLILKEVSSDIRKIIWLGNCYHMITVDNEREIVVNETINFITQIQQSHQLKKQTKSPAISLVIKDRSD